MNTLKKALTKDDVKKYQKKTSQQAPNFTKISQTTIFNRNNWTDANQFIECVNYFFIKRSTKKNSPH